MGPGRGWANGKRRHVQRLGAVFFFVRDTIGMFHSEQFAIVPVSKAEKAPCNIRAEAAQGNISNGTEAGWSERWAGTEELG